MDGNKQRKEIPSQTTRLKTNNELIQNNSNKLRENTRSGPSVATEEEGGKQEIEIRVFLGV